jgi:hypothetical protein
LLKPLAKHLGKRNHHTHVDAYHWNFRKIIEPNFDHAKWRSTSFWIRFQIGTCPGIKGLTKLVWHEAIPALYQYMLWRDLR